MRCAVTGDPYTVFGYDGKQVRDNIHSDDVVSAFAAFHDKPRSGAVYNLGGGRESNCSMREAITACERISGNQLDWSYSDEARMGDHRWWISDLSAFKADYPEWTSSRRRCARSTTPSSSAGPSADLVQLAGRDVVDEPAHGVALGHERAVANAVHRVAHVVLEVREGLGRPRRLHPRLAQHVA